MKTTDAIADASVDQIRDGIEHTRQEMTETITALEARLRPDTLSARAHAELDQIEYRVKGAMKEGIVEAKAAVEATLKEGVKEAKEAVTIGLKDARETVKRDVQEVIDHTKHSVREATLGRVEKFATRAGDVMNDTRETLVETIRQNPVPAALAGIGIAWLLMNRSSGNRRREGGFHGAPTRGFNPYEGMGYGMRDGGIGVQGSTMTGGAQGAMNQVGRAVTNAQHAVADRFGNVAHRAGEMVGHLGETVTHAGSAVAGAAHDASAAAAGMLGHGAEMANHLAHDTTAAASRLAHGAGDAAHAAADSAGQLVHRAGELAGEFYGTTREQAEKAEAGIARVWETNPLAFGLAAVAVGAAVGYALPRTEKEDALMGQVRDRVVHQAAEAASGAARSLEHLAEEAGKAVTEVVKSANA